MLADLFLGAAGAFFPLLSVFLTLLEREGLSLGAVSGSGSLADYYLPFLARFAGACSAGSSFSSLLRVDLLPFGSASLPFSGAALGADLLLDFFVSFFSAFGAFSCFIPFNAAAIYFFMASTSPLFLLLALPLTTLRRLSVRSWRILSF